MRMKTAVLALVVLGVPGALAAVNLKNGNFYVSYTDLQRPDKFELERTYNSRSRTLATVFGYGWAYNFGGSLELLPGGVLRVRPHGAGGTRDYAAAPSRMPGVDRWVSASGKEATFDGTEFRADTDTGLLIFDQNGLLVEHRVEDKRILKVTRTHGLVTAIETRRGDPVTLTYTTNGLLKAVEADGRTARYEYMPGDLLGYSVDTGGNAYAYGYDRDARMTAIRYSDGPSVGIAYGDDGNVASVTDRETATTNYYYGGPTDEWYWTLTHRPGDAYAQPKLYEYETHPTLRYTARIRTWDLPPGYAGGPVTEPLGYSEERFAEGGQSLGSSRNQGILPVEFVLPATLR